MYKVLEIMVNNLFTFLLLLLSLEDLLCLLLLKSLFSYFSVLVEGVPNTSSHVDSEPNKTNNGQSMGNIRDLCVPRSCHLLMSFQYTERKKELQEEKQTHFQTHSLSTPDTNSFLTLLDGFPPSKHFKWLNQQNTSPWYFLFALI